MKNITLILFVVLAVDLFSQEKVVFKASDGLDITGDLYFTNPENSPFIVLFHQAGWSRGEYLEIAPKLVKMGYNCLAVDQRSGGTINDVVNETHKRAEKLGKNTTYVDAEVDLSSAVDYVKLNYQNRSKLIVWGSSYSAALVLKLAGGQDVDAVLSFAPGEYFKRMGKPADYILQSAKNITAIPVFITSMKAEKTNWWKIYEAIPSEKKTYFLPKTNGQHGSRALWEKFDEQENYWEAVEEFLNSI